MSTIIEITWDEARALAYKVARSKYAHEDAEDIAQDVCLSLLSAGTFGRGLVAARTYARMIDTAKRGDSRRAAEEKYAREPEPGLDAQTTAELTNALAGLTPGQRDMVELVVLRGHTVRDAARLLGSAPMPAHERLVRGLRALQRKLAA